MAVTDVGVCVGIQTKQDSFKQNIPDWLSLRVLQLIFVKDVLDLKCTS